MVVTIVERDGKSFLKAKDPDVGGGVDRSKLAPGDFVFGDERVFPVVTPADVEDAVSSWGRYKGTKTFDQFKAKLKTLCRRKGASFMAKLPKDWGEAKAIADLIDTVVAKALYDAGQSPTVWMGVSHNAWIDDIQDTIPLKLIEDDIAWQKAQIEAGKWKQFGDGLWLDHKSKAVIGDCQVREIVDGGRSCFEAGNLQPDHADLDGAKMSIGYKAMYLGDPPKREYFLVYVYERSALKATRRVNGRTFFSVKRRQLLSDVTLKSVADELSAFME